ncbi:MAG: lysylphosphatidylglycerol synthase transmembrane domain-containing protein, partial [Methylocella sp.]
KKPMIVESSPTGKAVVEPTELRRVLPLLVTGILLGGLAFIVDIPGVFRKLVTISPAFLGLAVTAMAANVLIVSLRYQQVLEKLATHRPVLRDVLNINLLTLFSAHFLPIGAAADGLRVSATAFQFRLPVVIALEGVVHDRVLAIMGLLLCLFLILPLQVKLGVEEALLLSQLGFAIGFSAIAAALLRIGARPARATGRWRITVGEFVERFVSQVADIRCLLVHCALATAGTTAFAAMLYFLARGLAAEVSLFAAIAFAPAIYLSQVLPFFYVGFGAREAVSVALLAGSGTMDLETAVAISVSVGVCNLLVSLPGALSASRYLGHISAFRRKPETQD